MLAFANPTTLQPLEDVVAEINNHWHDYTYSHRIGMEVVGTKYRAGERHTLIPQRNSLGVAPKIGDTVVCHALGLDSQWQVVAVAEGRPGDIETR